MWVSGRQPLFGAAADPVAAVCGSVAPEMPKPRIFQRVFIANRGEVAARIARACDELNIVPVFGVSAADSDASYVRGRETVLLGPARATESYLDSARIVQAARQTGCSAIHPGWGFLAENGQFAALCEAHGITFVGPPAHVIQQMSNKTRARMSMAAAGLSLIPGSDGVVSGGDEALAVAERIGYPVIVKADSGGGGRGMRVARSAEDLVQAVDDAAREAAAAFGDARVYLERLIEGGRHIEIQLMADRYGQVVHLGERDCSVQRNHQKLIEESPAPTLSEAERERTTAAAVRAARAIGYVGAGTMEFLLGTDGVLRFMEMNTRLQVEHSVSEMRSGFDLVREQIRVAAGHRLSATQSDVVLAGHAIECRVNAEDPADGFRPCPGRIARWHGPDPAGGDIRVDTHIATGDHVSPHYDSLLCKIIARGATRDQACDRMLVALDQLVCDGVATTVSMHRAILASPKFRAGAYDTRTIPGWPAN
jgi:acetyl-CoA carboxylase, biotin carboxylase subunit